MFFFLVPSSRLSLYFVSSLFLSLSRLLPLPLLLLSSSLFFSSIPLLLSTQNHFSYHRHCLHSLSHPDFSFPSLSHPHAQTHIYTSTPSHFHLLISTTRRPVHITFRRPSLLFCYPLRLFLSLTSQPQTFSVSDLPLYTPTNDISDPPAPTLTYTFVPPLPPPISYSQQLLPLSTLTFPVNCLTLPTYPHQALFSHTTL
ncbi:hypothetical protein F5H01DRAFT_96150 [Linnemannia elongata]|nr:hypothetical protein F5H01DRAFT_96150 [Linnemannia elongata]